MLQALLDEENRELMSRIETIRNEFTLSIDRIPTDVQRSRAEKQILALLAEKGISGEEGKP